ncbi:AbrB/MazE/SpoVT family DNA-binding domain-containing protein [Paenalkalicoccus suaedae]|uniref:AbrB/MazE/SpoVT family DNA-binding domain-containing protein n=1 Tax=Paenalkalicoccus suaedae TaxID=2592382 RepID=A0A859FHV4_9BACI|nr:AbrB/MazE/SpoVT family DNA-binding domain-containing protein [Paenalkalicoccus suaedae]QKS72661.1 AbrB/MazE/SpoVT family DNA-binding domain-containing protein [Paenalkalicoccus suaedae]
MERKVTKIGNSLGVTFPADLLERLGVRQGDTVVMEEQDGALLIRKSQKVELPKGISPDFFDTLDANMTKYDQAIKGLVER